MHLPASSSLLGVVMILVVFGGTGLYFLFRKKRTSAAAEPMDLGVLGFLRGEGVRSHGIGKILFIDERDTLGSPSANLFECNGLTLVTTRMTTSDRLLVEVNGQRMWFDATSRPVIRRIGRIMQQDTTGVLDMLANQMETTVWFIRDGKQTPPGAGPKKQYNGQSAIEDVYVVELIAPCRPALRFEAVESVAIALCQWAQAPVKATMEIPVFVPMLAVAPCVAPQQMPQAQPSQPPSHGQTMHMIGAPARPSQPPHFAHHSSHPPHYAAAPVAVQPPSQSRRSVAPSAAATIRRRSQPSQAAQAQVMPLTPCSGAHAVAPQMAQCSPPRPQSYAPPAAPQPTRSGMLPPPLPQYYARRFAPTLQSPQFTPGSY